MNIDVKILNMMYLLQTRYILNILNIIQWTPQYMSININYSNELSLDWKGSNYAGQYIVFKGYS